MSTKKKPIMSISCKSYHHVKIFLKNKCKYTKDKMCSLSLLFLFFGFILEIYSIIISILRYTIFIV